MFLRSSTDGSVQLPIAPQCLVLMQRTPRKDGATVHVDVSSAALERLHSYLEHHQGAPPSTAIARPLRSRDMHDVTDAWDAAYVDDLWTTLPRRDFYALLHAAHHHGIQCLLELLAARVAAAIKGEQWIRLASILQPNEASGRPPL
jgi:hypothetical protein